MGDGPGAGASSSPASSLSSAPAASLSSSSSGGGGERGGWDSHPRLVEARARLKEYGGKLDEASDKWDAALDVVFDRGWARPRAAVKLFAGELAATALAGALAALVLVAAADYARLRWARDARRRRAMGHPSDPMYPLVPPGGTAAGVRGWTLGGGLIPSFLGWVGGHDGAGGGGSAGAGPHSPRPPPIPEAELSSTCPPASPSPRSAGGVLQLQSEDGESGWLRGSIPDPYCPDKRKEYLNWDQYFMALAFLSAKRSKDPYKQVGAVIVSGQKIIIGIGYNGFPRGCGDDALSWAKKSRDGDPLKTKHPYVCHAEANAILNKNTSSCESGTIYVTMFPCNECAKLIIQSGIRTVVYAQGRKPGDSLYDASKTMMQLAGVQYRRVCGLDTSILIPAWPSADDP